jgi:uncharacterized cupin superfamily protein
LYKGPQNRPESGIWVVTPGTWRLSIPRDELCYFVAGDASYMRDDGELIEVAAGTCVHFSASWNGVCMVRKTLRNVYLLSDIESKPRDNHMATPKLHQPLKLTDAELKDWGPIPTMIEGESHTSGVLLHKGENGENESGIWQCTPGFWRCVVTRDEFCHFMRGRCTYIADDGEVIEITPDTIAFFRQGWSGTCRVIETIRKVYMIR